MPEFDATIEYRDIDGFPGYKIGNDGSVWSSWSTHGVHPVSWKQMKPQPMARGKRAGSTISFHRGGKIHTKIIARIVLQAFVGQCPAGLEACHNDGDPSNNTPRNLRWDTHTANMQDMVRHGRSARGERAGAAKVTDADVIWIRSMANEDMPVKDIAALCGLHPAHVSRIIHGAKWEHLEGAATRDRRVGGGPHTSIIRVCSCGRHIRGPGYFYHLKFCQAARNERAS